MMFDMAKLRAQVEARIFCDASEVHARPHNMSTCEEQFRNYIEGIYRVLDLLLGEAEAERFEKEYEAKWIQACHQ